MALTWEKTSKAKVNTIIKKKVTSYLNGKRLSLNMTGEIWLVLQELRLVMRPLFLEKD